MLKGILYGLMRIWLSFEENDYYHLKNKGNNIKRLGVVYVIEKKPGGPDVVPLVFIRISP